MRTVAEVRTGVCSAHATGIGETQVSFASTGLDTSARSMQHGEPGVCTGLLRSCPVLRAGQHDPVAARAVLETGEPDVETSWHSTPARSADGDAYALTMQ